MEVALRKPIVYLVGAGPGDPGLLTLRGQQCLQQADFVLYDQLVSTRVLKHVSPQAEMVCIRDLPGEHPERWPHIHAKLIEQAKQGKCVVRLKGGDPLIFGRGGEEAEALRQAGIPYEIVPGVTTALAAGAYLEIPLTHRHHSSAIALITGHEHPTKPNSRLDWAAIAKFPGTLAIYMGFGRLPGIVQELIRHGKAPSTPAAVISKASSGEQQSVQTTLEQLEEAIRQAGLSTPAIVLLGDVVALKALPSWFEQRPLFGKRILVTRPKHQAEEMMDQLEALGAVPFHLPTLEIVAPTTWHDVDRSIHRLREKGYDWLVFTSANGIDFFCQRVKQLGFDLRLFGSIQIAVIGSSTAEKLRQYHLEPDLAPDEEMNSETLASLLVERVAGQRILYAQAEQARDLLRNRLAEVANIESVIVYRQQEVGLTQHEVLDHLRRGEMDYITLTSPNMAKAFLDLCDRTIRNRLLAQQIQLVCNSSRTASYLKEMGFVDTLVSQNPTMQSLIERIQTDVQEQRSVSS